MVLVEVAGWRGLAALRGDRAGLRGDLSAPLLARATVLCRPWLTDTAGLGGTGSDWVESAGGLCFLAASVLRVAFGFFAAGWVAGGLGAVTRGPLELERLPPRGALAAGGATGGSSAGCEVEGSGGSA